MLPALSTALLTVALTHTEHAPSIGQWVQQRGGRMLRPLRAGVSDACGGGLGVFATEEIEADVPLCSIPLSVCLSAFDACLDPSIGKVLTEYLSEHHRGGAEPM